MKPLRQWIGEKVRSGFAGSVVIDQDLLVRDWDVDPPLGYALGIEVKTFKATTPIHERLTFTAMNKGRSLGNWEVRLIDGNTPERPEHFPESCPCCGLPEVPVASSSITLRFYDDSKDPAVVLSVPEFRMLCERPSAIVEKIRRTEAAAVSATIGDHDG